MLVDGSVTVRASRDEVKKDLHEFWSEVYYPITNEFPGSRGLSSSYYHATSLSVLKVCPVPMKVIHFRG